MLHHTDNAVDLRSNALRIGKHYAGAI
jgi:hypothetical protein